MPASVLDGGPNFAGSRLDVAIANIAQFGNAPTFPTGATFPSGAGVVFFGGGDDVSYSLPGTAFEMDARQGTSTAPILVGSGPTFKISRTEAITEASMPGGNGANNQGNAGLWVSTFGLAANEVQVSGVLGTAKTISTQSAHNDDACGIQGWASAEGSATGIGMGGYFHGRRLTDTGAAGGIQVQVGNFTPTNDTFNTSGLSKTTGVWVAATGDTPSVAAYVVGFNVQTYRVGFAAIVGSVTDQFIRDESSATTSYLINGTHTNAIAITSGAGGVWIGGTSQLQSPSLLEVQGPNSSTDPLVVFGSVANNQNYTLVIRNSQGQGHVGIATAGGLVPGSAAGDMVIGARTTGKALHIIGATKIITVTKADTLGFFAATPTGQIAGATDVLAGLVTLGLRAASSNPPLNLGTGALTAGDMTSSGHIVSTASGTPTTTNTGANVTSVTFTGNDVRGTIAVVMSGALAANTRIATCTFAVSYGATSPKVTLVDQTSAVGLTIVNFYVSAQSTGVSFDLACDQALAAGTYTIDYIVIG